MINLSNKIKVSSRIGLYDYPNEKGTYNVGDYVQSIAAAQFLDEFQFLPRDDLNNISEEKILLMNGWHTHKPKNFPPSDNIKPLLISFHLNADVADKVLKNHYVIKFFKKNEPIGCRDIYTKNKLNAYGINAYFSGCLTLTLNNTFKHRPKNKILLVDPIINANDPKRIFKSLKSFLLLGVKQKGLLNINEKNNMIKHILKDFDGVEIKNLENTKYGNNDPKKRLEEANDYLNELSSASLVITSRIHCALPCATIGVPVIFLDYKFNSKSDRSRFDGILDFFPTFSCDSLQDLNKINRFSKEVFGKTISNKIVQKTSEQLSQTVRNFLKE